jgi:pyruvate/2-oxoacid:ferredoxin oxidoreductase alpha subunit
MDPRVLTPTMPCYYGIKDSHRSGPLVIEPDAEVNGFLDDALARAAAATPPGLLDGDTAMGSCVTSEWFQGFKLGQKRRMAAAETVIAEVASAFEARFGRPGLAPLEFHRMDDRPEVVLVAIGPDAGTAVHLLGRMRSELGVRVGLVVVRLLTPWPGRALAAALAGAGAIGVVNNAHHHGRGHLTVELAATLAEAGAAPPIESFFCGLGGADVAVASWMQIARATAEAAARGRAGARWRMIHDGAEVGVEPSP